MWSMLSRFYEAVVIIGIFIILIREKFQQEKVNEKRNARLH
jgi:hypothetical protein